MWWRRTLLNASARSAYKSMTRCALTMEKPTQAHAPCELRAARVNESSKLWGKDLAVSFKVARGFPAVPLSSDWKYMKRLHQIEFYCYLVGSLSRQRNTVWCEREGLRWNSTQTNTLSVGPWRVKCFGRGRRKRSELKNAQKNDEKLETIDKGGKLSIIFCFLL